MDRRSLLGATAGALGAVASVGVTGSPAPTPTVTVEVYRTLEVERRHGRRAVHVIEELLAPQVEGVTIAATDRGWTTHRGNLDGETDAAAFRRSPGGLWSRQGDEPGHVYAFLSRARPDGGQIERVEGAHGAYRLVTDDQATACEIDLDYAAEVGYDDPDAVTDNLLIQEVCHAFGVGHGDGGLIRSGPSDFTQYYYVSPMQTTYEQPCSDAGGTTSFGSTHCGTCEGYVNPSLEDWVGHTPTLTACSVEGIADHATTHL